MSSATIHYYIREGLLPPATVKTSRNMAYYDDSFVPRIQLIRRLQEERHLPLRVIKSLLSAEQGEGAEPLVGVGLLQALAVTSTEILGENGVPCSRDQLVARTSIDPRDLDDLVAMGVVTVRDEGGRAEYMPLDAAIVETIAAARTLGLTRERFPLEDLSIYQAAVSALVGQEVPLFARRASGPEAALPSPQVLRAAIHVLGQFIVLLRRKLILDLMAGLGTTAPSQRRVSSRRRPAAR